MAFVVRRTTKAGTVSTALVESYRDGQGRPRHRLLANLHGEPNALRALARLALQQAHLVTVRKELLSGNTGEVVDPAVDEEVLATIDGRLAAIAREQTVLKQHCAANRKQIQAATRAYKRELDDAITTAMGAMLVADQHGNAAKKYKARVRRMRGDNERP